MEIKFVKKYIKLHNEGVKTGDFLPLFELFTTNAEFIFENIPFSPMFGLKAIRKSFEDHPPEDEIIEGELVEKTEDTVVLKYSWEKEPLKQAGILKFTFENKLIKKIVVA